MCNQEYALSLGLTPPPDTHLTSDLPRVLSAHLPSLSKCTPSLPSSLPRMSAGVSSLVFLLPLGPPDSLFSMQQLLGDVLNTNVILRTPAEAPHWPPAALPAGAHLGVPLGWPPTSSPSHTRSIPAPAAPGSFPLHGFHVIHPRAQNGIAPGSVWLAPSHRVSGHMSLGLEGAPYLRKLLTTSPCCLLPIQSLHDTYH